MKAKRAIRYLRISTERQSNFSIEGQDVQTRSWCERNEVEIVDTFTDEGVSAKNFDRPDMIKLNAFIAKHYRTIDYLVVNAYDRFSRDAGEALVAIKRLQRQFGISVVSVSEGVKFDINDPGSLFYAGLMLLKGEDEIVRNKSRIHLGIFIAKTQQGRYLGAAPFGYKNSRDSGNKPVIDIDEDKAPVIRYIFEAFVTGVPLYMISQEAKKKGLTLKGNSAITKILSCPVYTGLLHVNAYKEHPDQLVEGIHSPIIDRTTWHKAQAMMKKGKPVQIVSESLPLRSVLLCHCGKCLTGAPSTNRHGKKYFYYKCPTTSKHNNISAIKAHDQLQEVLKYMSLPEYMIEAIKETSEQLLEKRLKENTQILKGKRTELQAIQTKISSVEEKWISNQMAFETYQRWHTDLSNKRSSLNAQIEMLGRDQEQVWMVLQNELDKLGDISGLYNVSSTIQKQQIVKLGFDSRLYYKEGSYRTPYIMPVFSHNTLILKEKKLLIIDEKRELLSKFPSGGAEGFVIEPLINLLQLFHTIKVA